MPAPFVRAGAALPRTSRLLTKEQKSADSAYREIDALVDDSFVKAILQVKPLVHYSSLARALCQGKVSAAKRVPNWHSASAADSAEAAEDRAGDVDAARARLRQAARDTRAVADGEDIRQLRLELLAQHDA